MQFRKWVSWNYPSILAVAIGLVAFVAFLTFGQEHVARYRAVLPMLLPSLAITSEKAQDLDDRYLFSTLALRPRAASAGLFALGPVSAALR